MVLGRPEKLVLLLNSCVKIRDVFSMDVNVGVARIWYYTLDWEFEDDIKLSEMLEYNGRGVDSFNDLPDVIENGTITLKNPTIYMQLYLPGEKEEDDEIWILCVREVDDKIVEDVHCITKQEIKMMEALFKAIYFIVENRESIVSSIKNALGGSLA